MNRKQKIVSPNPVHIFAYLPHYTTEVINSVLLFCLIKNIFDTVSYLYLAVEKHNYHWCCKIDAIFIQQYNQNLLNFKHRYLFGVPSKISSFQHNFTDNKSTINILLKFVCRLRNVSKIFKFEYCHNQVDNYIH